MGALLNAQRPTPNAQRREPQAVEPNSWLTSGVLPVPAREHDDERRLRQGAVLDPAGDVVHDDLLGIGEALSVRELLAVVDDVDPEAEPGSQASELVADVSRAKDVERRRRVDRL